MKRYKITRYYTQWDNYAVDADSYEEALAKLDDETLAIDPYDSDGEHDYDNCDCVEVIP